MTRWSVALLSIALLVGCSESRSDPKVGKPGSSSPVSAKTLRIAVIPKATSLQYWKSAHAGAERAARELGNVEIIWKGPAQEDNAAGQIEVVKNMITQRVDGICLAPNHAQALVDVVQEANDEGIPVVIFDSGLGKGAEIVSYVATDNREGGRLAARRLAEVLGEKGDVILLRYRAGSESTAERETGFLEEITRHTGIRVLSSDQYGEASARQALEKASQLLLRFQDEVDGIFAVCEPNCHGVLEALEQSGLTGKVKFVAFDPSDLLIKALEADKVHGIILQDPVHMGYTAVKAVVARIQGQAVEPRIATGEHVATRENMTSGKIHDLLHPELFGE